MPKDYWQQAANRRKYFEDFAHEMGFDPLSTKAWLKVNPKRLVVRKVSDIVGVVDCGGCVYCSH